MELALYLVLGLIVLLICWKPFSTFRKVAPEGMDITLRHGIKILKVNILEDEQELSKRTKKIKEARDNNELVDIDNLWDEMHPQK